MNLLSKIKKDFAGLSVTATFLLILCLTFVVSVLISTALVMPRVENSIVGMQESTSQVEIELTAQYLHQFVFDRKAALNDIAEKPIIKNGVMESGIAREDLDDFLRNITVLEKKEDLAILNILAEPVYSRSKGTGQQYSADNDWFERLIEGKSEFELNLVVDNGDNYFQLAVPVKLDGYVEGVIVSEILVDLDEILAPLFSSRRRALSLNKNAVSINSSQTLKDESPIIITHMIEALGVSIEYMIDSRSLQAQKQAVLWTILASLLMSLGLTFGVLLISGRQALLNPYKRLAVSEATLRVANEEAKENEKRALRSELELSEQKFALDKHAIVTITDIKGNITYVNDLFCEVSEYSREELLGSNHRILRSGYHEREFFREMYHTIRQGNVWHGEICNRSKSQREYWVDTTIVPFVDEQGKPKSYIAIRTDVSALKQAERDMEAAKMAAEDSARAKSEFLASMSHEIRTPMNGVLGMLGILEKSILTTDQMRQLTLAKDSANSLLVIINDILDFSKIESGKLELESLDFDLCRMLGDFSESMGLRASDKNIELIMDIRNVHASRVKGDPGRLRQVLTNLVSNALKFTQEGEVVIRASLTPGSGDGLLFTCSVTDTGIGIRADKLDSLFESFTQADSSTTRKYGGTGLGLTICKQLCELMDGSISAVSELNVGSTFTFTIELKQSLHSVELLPQVVIDGRRILVVDDNAINCAVLKGQLAYWGAIAEVANSGDGALAILQSHNKPAFDLAIIDMQMPGMDGAELGRRIRADARFDTMKLVLMTSMRQQGDARKFADIGFDGYFPKPVTIDDLFRALAVITDNGNALSNATPLLTSHYLRELKEPKFDIDFKGENRLAGVDACARVLLVEDNLINQEVAKGILDDLRLSIDVASNGLEALEMLKTVGVEQPYQLLLMDCQMPEMDGYEASRAIRAGRAGGRYVEVPILAMTANAMRGDKEKCLAAGMNDYISKPLDVDNLETLVVKWLRISSTSEASPVKQTAVTEQSLEADEARAPLIWDQQAALKRCRNKPERLISLLSSYVENSQQEIDALERAGTQYDLSLLAKLAHGLKGVAANMGGDQFVRQLELLEASVRAEENFDSIDILIAQAVADYGVLRNTLSHYLSQQLVDK